MNKILLSGIGLFLFLFPKTSFAQNTAPVAANDYISICENSGVVNMAVLSNDFDLENNTLTASIYSGPQDGVASLSGNTINYTPDLNFNGNDTVEYVVCDNGSPSMCDTAFFVITVNPTPVADAGPDQTICFRDSTVIGTSAEPGITYLWTPSTGLSSSTAAEPNASPSSTTTYFLLATNSITGCTNRDTIILTINPLPVANAGPDHVACEYDSVMLGTAGVSGNTYYWSPIIPLNWNSLPQPMASPSTTTTFTLIVTTTATGCFSTDSVLVTINPAPPTDAGPDQTVCNGDSVLIGSPGLVGYTYLWSPAQGLSSTTVAEPMSSPSVTTIYTLIVHNSTTGCSDTDRVIVTVGAGAIANAGPDQSSCDGDSVQIGSTGIVGNTYNWSPSSGLSSSTVAQPMASPLVTTTYTLTVTNSTSGCTSMDVVVVSVGVSPIANAGADQQICAGGSVIIGSPAVAGYSYSWSPTSGLNSSTIAQPTASPAVTTTYVLTVTQTASGCQSTDNVVVTVNPNPIANAGPNQTSCNGDSVMIGSAAIGGMNYSWLPVTGLSSSTVAQPMADPLATTSYTLTVTNGTTGCTSTDVVVVTVGSAPLVNAGTDQTICSGDSVQLGTPAIPGNTYSWTPATGLNSATVAQPMASPSTTTTYIVTLTNTASGCQTSDDVIVNVNPLPIANAGPNQVSCDGDSVMIGTAAIGGMNYSWSPAIGLSSSTVAQPMAAPIVTTTYTLTVTNSTTGCQNTSTVTVTTGTAPVANAGADQTICNGDSAQIGTPAVSGHTYTWSPATGLSATNIAQPFASPTITTTYTLTETNAVGCSATDAVTIFVNPLPIANAGPDQGICPGSSVVIGTSGIAGNTYSWSPASGLNSTIIAQPTANPTVTTTYTLTVTNTATGCSNTDVVVVNTFPVPTADAGPDRTICAGDLVAIGTATISGNTYSWNPSTGLSSSTVAQPNANPSTTTSYTVTVTNANGCTNTDVVIVTVNPVPIANAGNGGIICLGESIMIGAPAVAGATYSWSPATGLSSSTDSQPSASPSSTTTYTLTETVGGCSGTNTVTVVVNIPVVDAGIDQAICGGSVLTLGSPAVSGYTYQWSPPDGLNSTTIAQPTSTASVTITYTVIATDTTTGCSSSDAVVFTSGMGGDGGVFNAFSPNGDGVNDFWRIPLAECNSVNEVTVINRWGNEVWQGKNYNNVDVRWDGKNLSGTDVTDGTYYYIIKYNDTEARGWLFVKR